MTEEEVLREALVETTDTANGRVLAHLYGGKLKYDHKRKRWIVWTKSGWREDLTGRAQRMVLEVAKFRATKTFELPLSDKERKRLLNFASTSTNNFKVEQTLAISQKLWPLYDKGDKWDSNPWLLGTKNGVIDLRTGKHRPAQPEDRVTLSCNVEYDPKAKCPRFKSFLDEIFQGDKELVRFIHRALGYSLTGATMEQAIFMGYGSGGENGKSTLITAIKNVLGDYAWTSPQKMFVKNRSDNTSDQAMAEHRRVLFASETQTSSKFNEELLKRWSGGTDEVTCRRMHKDWITFRPVAKIWFFANHRPTVDDNTRAFWRRIRMIPFEKSFTGADRDDHLESKLKAESAGILRWLVKGCLRWQKHGLGAVPGAVLSATEEYQAENDLLYDFKEEMLDTSDPEATTKATELYQAYNVWCDGNHLKLNDRMKTTGFYKKMAVYFGDSKRNNRGRYYVGVRVRDPLESQFPEVGAGNALGEEKGLMYPRSVAFEKAVLEESDEKCHVLGSNYQTPIGGVDYRKHVKKGSNPTPRGKKRSNATPFEDFDFSRSNFKDFILHFFKKGDTLSEELLYYLKSNIKPEEWKDYNKVGERLVELNTSITYLDMFEEVVGLYKSATGRNQ